MSSLRNLPGIDALLQSPAMASLVADHGTSTVKRALRHLQDDVRRTGSAPPWAGDEAAWAAAVAERLGPGGYRTVFNLTGTVLHTNLGRALPSRALMDAVRDLVTRPLNLEYDLSSGARGQRDAPVAARLTALTGAQAATVVNNNAAALLLVLNTLARDAEVPVSRGELIEIGGSFRLPDVMERAGCRLLEVGTTNRTHAEDFRATAERRPALLLKVHPSNYQISGFTHSVDVGELGAIARELGVPLCVDLGSGTLVDLARFGLPHEPMPSEALAAGADLVTFSGDKLLGGVQAGLIVGRRDLVEACNRNPLKRALRPDKITLTLLDRVLALYDDPDTLPEHLPLLRTLTLPVGELERRAGVVAHTLSHRLPTFDVEVVPSDSQIGSGSLPDRTLPSVAVRVRHPRDGRVRAVADALRALPIPVLGRLFRGMLWLDMRGAEPLEELTGVLDTLELPP